jgi:ALG6, ALG8 glycosyltransferase family
MAFYLFSFHVHEKHIILPLLFFGLAINDFKHYFSMFVFVASWSMYDMIQDEMNTSTLIGLVIGFHYFVRKLEGVMLNSFRIDTP